MMNLSYFVRQNNKANKINVQRLYGSSSKKKAGNKIEIKTITTELKFTRTMRLRYGYD